MCLSGRGRTTAAFRRRLARRGASHDRRSVRGRRARGPCWGTSSVHRTPKRVAGPTVPPRRSSFGLAAARRRRPQVRSKTRRPPPPRTTAVAPDAAARAWRRSPMLVAAGWSGSNDAKNAISPLAPGAKTDPSRLQRRQRELVLVGPARKPRTRREPQGRSWRDSSGRRTGTRRSGTRPLHRDSRGRPTDTRRPAAGSDASTRRSRGHASWRTV